MDLDIYLSVGYPLNRWLSRSVTKLLSDTELELVSDVHNGIGGRHVGHLQCSAVT